MPAQGIGAIVALLLLVLAIGLFGGLLAMRKSGGRRREELAELAARLGLALGGDDPGLFGELPPFELLTTGRTRKISNVMRGERDGIAVVLFDYSFVEVASERFLTLHHNPGGLCRGTIACLRAPSLSLPQFVLEPCMSAYVERQVQATRERIPGDAGVVGNALLGFAKHLFHDPPGWSFPTRPDVEYRARGADEPAVRALFTPPLLDHFRAHPGWIVEGRDDWLLFSRPGFFQDDQPRTDVERGLLKPQEVEAFLAGAMATAGVFRGEAG